MKLERKRFHFNSHSNEQAMAGQFDGIRRRALITIGKKNPVVKGSQHTADETDGCVDLRTRAEKVLSSIVAVEHDS